jgi:hypothetical protein
LIEDYAFGRIKAHGKTLETDAVITASQIVERRNFDSNYDGHTITLKEVKKIVDKFEPEVFVIGTGASGVAQVLPEVDDFLQEQKITLVKAVSGEAMDKFNEQVKKGKKVVALFHLTC